MGISKLSLSRLAKFAIGLAVMIVGSSQAIAQSNWRSSVPYSVQTTASARLDSLYAAGCQPFKAKGVDYNGCPGDAPPPKDDMYQTALSRGFQGSREKLIEACKTNANLCVVDPIPHDCPTGTMWSQAGGMPHCVRVDPACISGYQLVKDALGNPSCQVVAAPCTPGTTSVTGSCSTYYGAGTWTGNVFYSQNVICPGNIKEPKVYDYDTCVDTSVVTCPSDVTVEVACKTGTTGTAYKTTTYSGSSCTASTLPIDYSGCTPTADPCPDPEITSGSCGSGYTGNTVITTTYSGSSCTGKTTTDRSGCVADPTPCPSPVITNGSCGSGYTGNTVITTTYSGSSCTGTSTTDRSQCVPVVTCPDPVITSGSCGSGYTGSTSIITTYSGSSCTASSTTDRSQCIPVVVCSDPIVTSSACPAPDVGEVITTTTFSGSSCTPSTVVDKSGCSRGAPPSCTPGVGMMILTGGKCVDCATYPWSNVSLASNSNSTARACYTYFNTNGD